MQLKSMLALAARETLSPPKLDRRTTQIDTTTMSVPETRQAEDAAARASLGITHFAALAASRLLPDQGLVLDLNAGSGAFGSYLSARRPDASIMGVENSEILAQIGQEFLVEQCLTDRVNINVGEITDFSKRIPNSVNMITCAFGLHRLESGEALLRCLKEISLVRIRCGCSVLLIDFARPNLPITAEEAPNQILTSASLPVLRRYRNALSAAFTFAEMSAALGKVSLGTVISVQSRGLKILQAHWIEPEQEIRNVDTLWTERSLPPPALQQFKDTVSLMPGVKLSKHLK